MKKQKIALPTAVMLIAFILFVLIVSGELIINIRQIDDLDIYQINQRRSYFPKFIAPVFSNKIINRLELSVKDTFAFIPR